MTTKLFICGNDETICSGYTNDRISFAEAEIALAYVEAAVRVIDEARLEGADIDYEINHNFHDWHGGRMEQFYVGWGVKYPLGVSPDIVAIADKASHAASKARDQACAEATAQVEAFDREDAEA